MSFFDYGVINYYIISLNWNRNITYIKNLGCFLNLFLQVVLRNRIIFYSKLGQWIAQRRTAEVQKKYQEIGGGSPILKWTNLQGELLCKQLDRLSPKTAPHKHYVAFRYVKPFTEDAFTELER